MVVCSSAVVLMCGMQKATLNVSRLEFYAVLLDTVSEASGCFVGEVPTGVFIISCLFFLAERRLPLLKQ